MVLFYQYTDEYVLNKTPKWTLHKFEMVMKEKYQTRRAQQADILGAVSQALDGMFNGEKANNHLLSPIEEVLGKVKKEEIQKKKFIQGTWWKK